MIKCWTYLNVDLILELYEHVGDIKIHPVRNMNVRYITFLYQLLKYFTLNQKCQLVCGARWKVRSSKSLGLEKQNYGNVPNIQFISKMRLLLNQLVEQ